jgi:DNA (cytosine-5)-methyltransferase 1
MAKLIPVIDLFAGPGGLGEGFSSFQHSYHMKPFKVTLSIEKDPFAHSTLELRAFFRAFDKSPVPKDYYAYLRGEISRDELFRRYPSQSQQARNQAWLAELGSGSPSNEEIDERITKAINNNPNWVLVGGPPCQAYSLVGRSRNHKKMRIEFEKDSRHFLYREYLRIVATHQPPVFVLENVKGLLSSKVEGKNMFDKILRDLRTPGDVLSNESGNSLKYKIYSLVNPKNDNELEPSDYVIKSENYGIPQKRHRVILIGIRSNIHKKPGILKSQEQISMEKAISDLPKIRSGVSKEKDSVEIWESALEDVKECEWMKEKCVEDQVREKILETLKNINNSLSLGSSFFQTQSQPDEKFASLFDENLRGVCNHLARKHMRSDLYRYFFAACFAISKKRTPKLCDFPKGLLPKHKNILSGVQGTMFSDRFRVQLPNNPSTTITSHISKDGHYYIHPDPLQCRSLTVREAARLQTFPDNYLFEGNQTQQYHQVGNAVPPLLAIQIADEVYKVLTK